MCQELWRTFLLLLKILEMNSEKGYVPECTDTTWSSFSKRMHLFFSIWNIFRKLSLICINVRSLLGNFDQLVAYLLSLKGKVSFIILPKRGLNLLLIYYRKSTAISRIIFIEKIVRRKLFNYIILITFVPTSWMNSLPFQTPVNHYLSEQMCQR